MPSCKTTWSCGHARAAENGHVEHQCRICRAVKTKQEGLKIAPVDRYNDYRARYLPGQLERARTRVVHLEREAVRLGLGHLLNSSL